MAIAATVSSIAAGDRNSSLGPYDEVWSEHHAQYELPAMGAQSERFRACAKDLVEILLEGKQHNVIR